MRAYFQQFHSKKGSRPIFEITVVTCTIMKAEKLKAEKLEAEKWGLKKWRLKMRAEKNEGWKMRAEKWGLKKWRLKNVGWKMRAEKMRTEIPFSSLPTKLIKFSDISLIPRLPHTSASLVCLVSFQKWHHHMLLWLWAFPYFTAEFPGYLHSSTGVYEYYIHGLEYIIQGVVRFTKSLLLT